MLSCFSHVWLFMILWTVAHQGPLSMGFSRQEYWSGLPCPSPGDPPDPGIEPMSLMSPTLAGGFFTTTATWENPWLSSSKIKQTFPFHQPCLFIGFSAVSSWTPLSITLLFRNTETNAVWSGQDGSFLAPCISFDQSVLFFFYTLLTWLTFPLSHRTWSITAYLLLHNLYTCQPTFGPSWWLF